MRTAFAFVTSIAAAVLVTSAQAETIDIPLNLTGPNASITLSINNGAPMHWVFDTGAAGSLMDIDQARALGLREEEPVQISSPVGGTPMEGFLTTLTNVRVGDASVASMRVAAVPWNHEEPSGVLSPNVFAGRLVTIDFGHERVRVSSKTLATTPRGAATPYRGEGQDRLPAIPVNLGARSWMAHIDSGSPGGLTFPYAMAASLPLEAAPVRIGAAQFVDGVHPLYRATLNARVQVGPLTLDHAQIELIDGLPNLNVGMQLLRRIRLTLDPERQRSWAEAAE